MTAGDDGIDDVDVWSGAIAADATVELRAAEEAWEDIHDSITGEVTVSLADAERIWRDLITRLEGDAELSADKAANLWDALEERWEKEITSGLTATYKAVTDLGGVPNIAAPYVYAALNRDDPVQDAIDQIYAPRGQLVEAADPVDPFGDIGGTGVGELPPADPTSSSSSDSSSTDDGEDDDEPADPTDLEDSSTPDPPRTVPMSPIPPVYEPPSPDCVQDPASGLWGRMVLVGDPAFPSLTFIEDATCIPVLVPPSPPSPPPPPPPDASSPPPPPPAQCCPEQPDVIVNLPPPPTSPPAPITINLWTPTPIEPQVFPNPQGIPDATAQALSSWDDPGRCLLLGQGVQANDPAKFAEDAGKALKGLLNTLMPAPDTTGAPVKGLVTELLRGAVDGIGNAAQVIAEAGIGAFTIMTGIESITNPAMVFASMPATAVATWLTRLVGGPWEYLVQGKLYDIQYSAPQFLPSQPEIDAMFLTSRIDDGLWECYTKAHGNLPNTRRLFRDSQATRPSVGEEIALEMRGVNTPAATDYQLSRMGVLSDRDRAAFRLLQNYVPGAGDLIRFMLRDSFDPAAVAAGGFDQDFEDKFTNSPEALKIARANGIDESTMRLFWRAHWNIPSYTQLTEAMHRLRPGRAPAGVDAVTPAEVENALKIDDMAPTWVKRMMAVSYNTITRTDIQQFFNDGAFDLAEVIERLQDVGYNLEDSKAIAAAWDSIRVRRQSNIRKVWTTAKVAKEYIGGGLNYDEANLLLTQTGLSGSQAYATLKQADAARAVVSRNACIKGVKTRFMRGEFPITEAQIRLIDLGMDAQQAITIGEGWDCLNISRDKQATVAKLQQWFHRGTLSKDDVYTRLINLHYKPADAEDIILNMIMSEEEKRDSQFKQAFNERLNQAKKFGKLTVKQKKYFAEEVAMLEEIAAEKLEAAKAAKKRLTALQGAETRRNNAGTRAEAVRAGIADNDGSAAEVLAAPIPPQPSEKDPDEMDTTPE